jgi:MYXO-CTERM domain-containing protein
MVPCDDGTFCTKDNITCPSGACSSDPVAMDGQLCVPTNKCVYNGTCNNGTCGGGTPVNCDDGNPCTTDDCDPATGCTHTNEPVTTLCIDGNPCTTEDHCRPVTGKCQGVATVCAALDDCHAPGTCDSATGRCDDPRRVDGFPCANTTGRCASGVCQFDAVGAAGAPGVAGSAGVPVGSGGSTSTTGTAGSTAVGGTSAKGGTTADAGDVYQRNPGGCNCNLPGRSSSSRLALLGLLGLARGFARRRRSPR